LRRKERGGGIAGEEGKKRLLFLLINLLGLPDRSLSSAFELVEAEEAPFRRWSCCCSFEDVLSNRAQTPLIVPLTEIRSLMLRLPLSAVFLQG